MMFCLAISTACWLESIKVLFPPASPAKSKLPPRAFMVWEVHSSRKLLEDWSSSLLKMVKAVPSIGVSNKARWNKRLTLLINIGVVFVPIFELFCKSLPPMDREEDVSWGKNLAAILSAAVLVKASFHEFSTPLRVF